MMNEAEARIERVRLSAAKARAYFEQAGRGLLDTRPVDAHPFAEWLDTVGIGGTVYEHYYVTLDVLKATGAPATAIHLVETYDPDSHAVVAIEFEHGDEVEPQIVPLGRLDLDDHVH